MEILWSRVATNSLELLLGCFDPTLSCAGVVQSESSEAFSVLWAGIVQERFGGEKKQRSISIAEINCRDRVVSCAQGNVTVG